ncbi:hypothetical protein C4559_02140 [Candidatus Microgenomates bacterium]|nr:MAG: hypothetical protein C4559_02140 [Candidatus Microgenomates bacterium]
MLGVLLLTGCGEAMLSGQAQQAGVLGQQQKAEPGTVNEWKNSDECLKGTKEQAQQTLGGDQLFWRQEGAIWIYSRPGQTTTLRYPGFGHLTAKGQNVTTNIVTDEGQFACGQTTTSGGPPTATPMPAPTLTPVPPAPTFTPVPPAPTFTPVPPAPTSTFPPPAPTSTFVPAPPAPPVSVQASCIDKREWLKRNFPQSTEGVQELGMRMANVQRERVRTHLFPCGGELVFDGFIILGPNEGFQGLVSMSVPIQGSVIDSHNTATFTGQTIRLGSDTIRATNGSVTGLSMTFWPWWDENPPKSDTNAFRVSGITQPQPIQPAPSTGATTGCIRPDQLATQMGWQNQGIDDAKFGGFHVKLSSPDTLPAKWEAIGEGKQHIFENDSNRSMRPGIWTVYAPFECREQLGFSK